MRIRRITAETRTNADRRVRDRRKGEDQGQSRALVAVQPQPSEDRTPRVTPRPVAPFIAQLIANHIQAPQTRARRRAEPDVAIAAYSVAQPANAGMAFRKSA
jgi:hypothetical protein